MSARRLHSFVIAPVVIALIGFSLRTSVIASDFTQSAGGTWNSITDWDAGIPNSVGAVANFDTLDLANGSNATVTLDGSVTAGTLLLGDIVPATASLTFPQPASNWIINPGTPGSSTLTLATSSGTPTINVVNPTAQPLNSAGPASNATFFIMHYLFRKLHSSMCRCWAIKD